MQPLTYVVLKAFEPEMRSQYEAFASKCHFDGHTYTLVSVELQPFKTPHKKWIAVMEVELDIVLDDGFKDHYSFKYAIGSDYTMGRYVVSVPMSQMQVFESYDTWGTALEQWLKTIYDSFTPGIVIAAPRDSLADTVTA